MSATPSYPESKDSKLKGSDKESLSSPGDNIADFLAGAIASESAHAIQYRTCSWQKARVQDCYITVD
jgi:hypothetical protein